jgi:hypothetical protein
MRYLLLAVIGCLTIALASGGCGRGSGDEGDANAKKGKESEPIKIDKLAGKLGVFDDGRIEVPLPQGWRGSANEETDEKDRDANLCRMASGVQRLPGIMVKVREYGDFKTLGESDLWRFVRNRSNEVPKERGGKGKFDVKSLSLKGFHGVEYAYKVKIGSSPFERLTLETVVDSRLYTLELTTVNGLREEARPALYAVATGLKFPKMANKPSAGRSGGDGNDGDAAKDEKKESEGDAKNVGEKQSDDAGEAKTD